MPHCQPEQLALAALREPLPADDAAHLGSCAECRAEVAALQRAVDAVAVPEFAEPGPPVAPPASVWAGIAAATGVQATPGGTASDAEPAAPAVTAPAAAGGQVLPLRRSRRTVVLVAAAAITGAVVGAGAVALLQGEDSLEPLTTVALEPLDGEPASGRAEVVVRPDGSRALEVDLDAPPVEDAYYEIWLIEPGVVDMVPLGVLRPGTQTFELPAGLDLAAYPIVDVSVEPLDGDPTHSGVSVARGQIES
ncbi:anti-sigma factor [Blastococcus sp. MG754426]|uniref:anti-sigma factor n=1 Tax=unclassified Blastococcus TaxID=2619396 RepID=UPI001EEFA12C|nr:MULTISPECIES: anti-sigma factor [unclassified Blastococcus]MCF6508602.1 anti-sigma factor [Blastococcus sp. MG754426]MCF6513241.1 anti-sigma factor [Blastococcus sp. MG754427]